MNRLHRLCILTAAPALALLALGAVAARRPAPVLINESPSLPEGLYLRDPGARPQRGAIVAIPQPDAVRPYLAQRGMPAQVRLIKRVAASGGDLVCSDGRRLMAPQRIVPVHARDRSGEPLPVWRGCRRLAPDERLLLGDTPDSLDSRYFGPVATARIEGVYREAWTW